MTKTQVSVIEALSNGGWMTSTQIASFAHAKKDTVRILLAGFVRDGVVKKKADPERHNGMLYHKAEQAAGFGIRANMQEFNDLISGVRAAYAATN
ncbi:hypothetical protein PMPD1_3108 [Paramixta manurensis]|uniref:MarR family transcriptional regulator n=1 Tax=Paramixta manurensis TaxID=2740817 RepID=A0A6M8UJV2_9GAMM|nr:hypothetical protein PMPD1_3108 [Erwiniaceae bacterium PD-1]